MVAVGLGFSGLLVIVSLVDLANPARTRHAWREWASTNLTNLGHHPLASLVFSAFLPDGDTLVWIVLSLVGLAATGWVLGSARTALLAVTAHLLGTLVSQGILAWRIAAGAAPQQARHIVDVGPSYIVVCALVAAIAYSTWPGRLLSAAGFALIAPYLFYGLGDWGVAEVGHACAVVVGLVLGYLVRAGDRSTTAV
jgi:hypothetical protein